MAEGKVFSINESGGFGFIQPDGGGQGVYFRIDWVKNPPPSGIRVGTLLRYEMEIGEKGPRAKRNSIFAVSGSATGTPGKSQTERSMPAPGQTSGIRPTAVKGYRFLNPYNFVRSPGRPHVLRDRPETRLLDRCPPPPHDRWVGLNGTITCQVEAVSPLFVSDSEHWEDSATKHPTYPFYQYDFGNGLEPALPASSLRGMLRSEFEAVTNSCFAHFEYGRRLTYHLPANEALKLIPAVVEQDDEERWWLRLLPGTAQIVVGDRPRDKLYAGRVEQYEAIDYAGKRRPAPPLRQVPLNGLKHGSQCYALLEEMNFPPVWNVVKVARDRKDLPQQSGKIVQGYLCINNQNIETKRFERFFFRDAQNRFGPAKIFLSEDVRRQYGDLIKDYHARHQDEVESWRDKSRDPQKPWIEKGMQTGKTKKKAAFSRFIIEKPRQVKDGDLVYAMLSGSLQDPKIEFIAPVAVPRVSYKRLVEDLLPMHLHKCQDITHLCPACRTFGWVFGNNENDKNPKDLFTPVAYAGRLRFSHGQLMEPARTMENVELTVLGSPKPTTTRFYLRPVLGKPVNGQSDFLAGYDNPDNILRGRKVYRHQGFAGADKHWLDKAREYNSRVEKSDQNRAVVGALEPGAKFSFTIQFTNLAPVELGALLWTLGLEKKAYHRLGYGKPLGFGSLRAADIRVKIVDPLARYSESWQSGEHIADPGEQEQWIKDFKAAMARAYQKPFEELPHIRELLTLLGEPPTHLPIHYPRTDVQPHPEGKNFEWFMGNNRNRYARFTLELPGEENGFPLIDRRGEVKQ